MRLADSETGDRLKQAAPDPDRVQVQKIGDADHSFKGREKDVAGLILDWVGTATFQKRK